MESPYRIARFFNVPAGEEGAALGVVKAYGVIITFMMSMALGMTALAVCIGIAGAIWLLTNLASVVHDGMEMTRNADVTAIRRCDRQMRYYGGLPTTPVRRDLGEIALRASGKTPDEARRLIAENPDLFPAL